jgi:uncharacterized protein (TIGR02217 family)
MSNEIYPAMPGLAFDVHRTTFWKTDIRTTPSGREYTSSQQVVPRRRIRLQYEFLRAKAALAELQTLEGFFNRHSGALSSFLFDDPDDNTVTAQTVGTGNGSTTAFQLVRTFGGYTQPIQWVNGTPSIYKAGTLQGSGYTVSSDGLLTFGTAPTSGQVITWTGAYCWRVRFEKDELDFVKFLKQVWKTGQVDLITKKDA